MVGEKASRAGCFCRNERVEKALDAGGLRAVGRRKKSV